MLGVNQTTSSGQESLQRPDSPSFPQGEESHGTVKWGVSPRLSSALEAELFAAMEQVREVSSQFSWAGIYLLSGETLELGPYWGSFPTHTRIPVGKGVCGTAVARNEDQNVPDVRAVDNYLACDFETVSELVVLIRDQRGRILGQIDIDSNRENAFGEGEEKQVRQIAVRLGEVWKELENQK